MVDKHTPQSGETQVFSRDEHQIQERFWNESAAMVMAEADEDSRSMKVAMIAALVLHFLLFVTVFPSMGGTAFEPEDRDTVVIKRYKPPTPPKEQPKKKVIKKSATRVPIPDPTPDEPEAIVAEDVEFVEDLDIPIDAEFVVGTPSGGPPVIDRGPMRVGGEIEEPTRIHLVNPTYTPLAERAGLEGTVHLEAVIDKQGNITNLKVLRGLGLGLDERALEAVQQWKYTPTHYNGRPVEVILNLRVVFQMR